MPSLPDLTPRVSMPPLSPLWPCRVAASSAPWLEATSESSFLGNPRAFELSESEIIRSGRVPQVRVRDVDTPLDNGLRPVFPPDPSALLVGVGPLLPPCCGQPASELAGPRPQARACPLAHLPRPPTASWNPPGSWTQSRPQLQRGLCSLATTSLQSAPGHREQR